MDGLDDGKNRTDAGDAQMRLIEEVEDYLSRVANIAAVALLAAMIGGPILAQDYDFVVEADCDDCAALMRTLEIQAAYLPSDALRGIDIYRPQFEIYFSEESSLIKALDLIENRAIIESLVSPAGEFEAMLTAEQASGISQAIEFLLGFESANKNPYLMFWSPQEKGALLYKGFRLLGRRDVAIQYLEDAITLAERLQEQASLVPLLTLAANEYLDSASSKVLITYKRLVDILVEIQSPIIPSVHINYGMALIKAGSWREALEEFTNAVKSKYFLEGTANERRNNLEAIKTVLLDALNNSSESPNELVGTILEAYIVYQVEYINLIETEFCRTSCSDYEITILDHEYNMLMNSYRYYLNDRDIYYSKYLLTLERYLNFLAGEKNYESPALWYSFSSLSLDNVFLDSTDQVERILKKYQELPGIQAHAAASYAMLAKLYFERENYELFEFNAFLALDNIDASVTPTAGFNFEWLYLDFEILGKMDLALLFYEASLFLDVNRDNSEYLPQEYSTLVLAKRFAARGGYLKLLENDQQSIIAHGEKILAYVATNLEQYENRDGGKQSENYENLKRSLLIDLDLGEKILDSHPIFGFKPAAYFTKSEMGLIHLALSVAYQSINRTSSAHDHLQKYLEYLEFINDKSQNYLPLLAELSVETDESYVKIFSDMEKEGIKLSCDSAYYAAKTHVHMADLKGQGYGSSHYESARKYLEASLNDDTTAKKGCGYTADAKLLLGMIRLKSTNSAEILRGAALSLEGWNEVKASLGEAWDSENYYDLRQNHNAASGWFIESCLSDYAQIGTQGDSGYDQTCSDDFLIAIDLLSDSGFSYDLFKGIAKISSPSEGAKGAAELFRQSELEAALSDIEFYSLSLDKPLKLYVAPLERKIESLINQIKYSVVETTADEDSEKNISRDAGVNIKSLSMNLNKGESLYILEHYNDGQAVSVLVNTSGISTKVVDVSKAELSKLVQRLRLSVDLTRFEPDSPPPEFDSAAASTLFDITLGNHLLDLIDTDHITVVTSGDLQSIPLSMLLTHPVSKQQKLSSYPWAYESYTFSRATSLTSFNMLRASSSGTAPMMIGSFLGVGDPVFGSVKSQLRDLALLPESETSFDTIVSTDLSSLPETRGEIETLGRSFSDKDKIMLFGENASERTLKGLDLAQFSTIAFATHGLISGELPGLTEPALVLSSPLIRTSTDDGFLTASEISAMNFDAQLVILSACNSYYSGDEDTSALSTLSDAFLSSGAKNLMVTHWAIESQVSVAITTRTLSEYMLAPGKGLANALREAITHVRQNDKWQHPAFWAPFSIVGNNY